MPWISWKCVMSLFFSSFILKSARQHNKKQHHQCCCYKKVSEHSKKRTYYYWAKKERENEWTSAIIVFIINIYLALILLSQWTLRQLMSFSDVDVEYICRELKQESLRPRILDFIKISHCYCGLILEWQVHMIAEEAGSCWITKLWELEGNALFSCNTTWC